MGRVTHASKFAGAAALGVAVALHDEPHTDTEIYQLIQPVGQLVFVASSTSMNTTSAVFSSTGLVLSPRFS